MRLLQISVLALGLASSRSFAHEAPGRDSPDQKRDQSVDDYYATSWTETATRGPSVVVIVHPHAQTHPHYETGTGRDDVARASTPTPEPCSVSTVSTASATPHSDDTPAAAELASSSPAPTPQPTAASLPLSLPLPVAAAPPPRITMTVLGSPFGSPAEISPMETFDSAPCFPQKTGKPTRPIDSSQVQVCTGGSYAACVASYSCSDEPTDVMGCYCRNNVREGCNNACGGDEKLQPEECPVLPVGTRPPGLPGPGDGPRLRRRLGFGKQRELPALERKTWWVALVNIMMEWQVGVI
ncbi:hypothetical protein TWF281_000409 [Arthrobotrys megalospora]